MTSVNNLNDVVLKIDGWLESMRGPSGYGGPVAHWWRDSLEFTGAGLDWRYEGIIGGYLNLFERTGQEIWLNKARRAGGDLVEGQFDSGNFRASSFEANPQTGGTPHEAACDLVLLRLAKSVREHNIPGWEIYAKAAERNINNYLLAQLWIPESGYFRNLANDPVFVPNKAATIVEALIAWMDFSGQDECLEKYILPTLDRIIDCQTHDSGNNLKGAVDQAQATGKRQGWFFPYYNARCIPALVLGYRLTHQERYLEAAAGILSFILRVRFEDGSFPQVIRPNGRMYRYPQWIPGVGDILRAMVCLEAFGEPIPKDTTLEWMLQGLLPGGGIRTAHGFARKRRLPHRKDLPDFRDLLPVTGWVDKAFQFLTTLAGTELHLAEIPPQAFEHTCQVRGRECQYYEDGGQIKIYNKDREYYRWQKGAGRAEVCAL
jgi:hypothetical protein